MSVYPNMGLPWVTSKTPWIKEGGHVGKAGRGWTPCPGTQSPRWLDVTGDSTAKLGSALLRRIFSRAVTCTVPSLGRGPEVTAGGEHDKELAGRGRLPSSPRGSEGQVSTFALPPAGGPSCWPQPGLWKAGAPPMGLRKLSWIFLASVAPRFQNRPSGAQYFRCPAGGG